MTWNGTDLPAESRDLPAGRYVVEAVEDEEPALSPEEESAIEAALESYRHGRVIDAKRARHIIDASRLAWDATACHLPRRLMNTSVNRIRAAAETPSDVPVATVRPRTTAVAPNRTTLTSSTVMVEILTVSNIGPSTAARVST